MAEPQQEGESVGMKTPFMELSAKGKRTSELIAVMCLCLLGITTYALWEHKIDDYTFKGRLFAALMDLSKNQRVTNCLMELSPESREGKLDWCERMAR